jgi:hypothetical protein
MKKFFAVILALCVCMSMTALAQYGSATKSDSTMKADKEKSIVGTIGSDGASFVSDKDKSSWKIENPDDVKGHEGHHVKLTCHVNSKDKSIHVAKVEMVAAKAEKKSSM